VSGPPLPSAGVSPATGGNCERSTNAQMSAPSCVTAMKPSTLIATMNVRPTVWRVMGEAVIKGGERGHRVGFGAGGVKPRAKRVKGQSESAVRCRPCNEGTIAWQPKQLLASSGKLGEFVPDPRCCHFAPAKFSR
jgi:hypothetical protein